LCFGDLWHDSFYFDLLLKFRRVSQDEGVHEI